jgi:hypothetical protein
LSIVIVGLVSRRHRDEALRSVPSAARPAGLRTQPGLGDVNWYLACWVYERPVLSAVLIGAGCLVLSLAAMGISSGADHPLWTAAVALVGFGLVGALNYVSLLHKMRRFMRTYRPTGAS